MKEFLAKGHPNITGTHSTTFEITKDTGLTRRGTCLIGVGASIGPRDLPPNFKNLCRTDTSRIIVELHAAGFRDVVEGSGTSGLTLRDSNDFVGRKSSYISDRTIMIKADKAARDLDKDLIEALKSSETQLHVRVSVEV